MSEATAILAGLGTAFCAGIFFATIILLGNIKKLVERFRARRRPIEMDDTWERSPWRDM